MTDLYDTPVSAGCLYYSASLAKVVTSRLLNVDMFSCLAGPDRPQSVPVVWSGEGYGIQVPVFEKMAHVFEGPGPLPTPFVTITADTGDDLVIHITNRGDLDAGESLKSSQVVPPPQAHHANTNRVGSRVSTRKNKGCRGCYR